MLLNLKFSPLSPPLHACFQTGSHSPASWRLTLTSALCFLRPESGIGVSHCAWDSLEV